MSQRAQSVDSSAEEEELSVLKYARKQGVSLNHLTDPRPWEQVQALQARVPDLIINDPHLPELDLKALTANFSTTERLTLPKEGAQLLASIMRPETSVDYTLPLLDVRRAKRLKVEEPILKTDNEFDLRDFANRDKFEPKLGEVQLPQEAVDEEKGEGLTIPKRFWALGDKMLEELKTEKLTIIKAAWSYLQDIPKSGWTEADDEKLWRSLQKYNHTAVLEPVTPPLLPSDPPPVPYEPTSSELEVPILSDPPSLIGAALQSIEEKLFEQDALKPISNGEFNNGSLSLPTLEEFRSGVSDDKKMVVRLEDLKVEETLTPPRQLQTPKNVNLHSIMGTIPACASPQSTQNLFQESYFEAAFGNVHEKVMQMVEQEKLPPEESIKSRVNEPIINLSPPEPPWSKIENKRHSEALEELQKDMLKLAIDSVSVKLKGMREINYKLPWNLFSKWKPDILLDKPDSRDEDSWREFINFKNDEKILDSSHFTWKPPGLRILEDNDDEEFEFGAFENEVAGPEQQQTGVITAAKDLLKIDTVSQPQEAHSTESPRRKSRAEPPKIDIPTTWNGPSVLIGGDFSAEDEMDNFLALRGSKRQKVGHSSYFQAQKESLQLKPVKIPQPLTEAVEETNIDGPRDTLPSPALVSPPYPVSIIVASALFKQRSMIRQIESLIPSLSITERDFSRHNTTTWEPGKVTRSPNISPLASEADLIISASTGVILTTLAKVRQKLLPGQKGKAAIRERVESVNLRYERLIVLVNEGGNVAQELSESDAISLTEFIAFVSSLPGCARVYYIAGDESVLGKWLTYHIIKNSPPIKNGEKGVTLLEDETHWELFLRRAGLNAFAAQAILSQLKLPERDVPDRGTSGLLAFVKMGNVERIKLFGDICGGSKVLERVGRVIDPRWE